MTFHRDRFHVVCMVSNPVRYKSRYELYRKFAEKMKAAGVTLWTCELQLGHRPFRVTDVCNPRHIQLRHHDELWHKENALNIAISRLPYDWRYVAWIDADIEFVSPGWVDECINQLQVYQVVQMFETAIDLGPTGQALATHQSFMSQYIKNHAYHPEGEYHEWHPGFAWACRREAFDAMGGLLGRVILGAGDRHMALAFIGKADCSFHPHTNGSYKHYIMNFQHRCERSLRRDVGFMPGTVLHQWHGKKKDRRYWDRWQILVKNKFEPYHDLKPNSYGVYQLHDDGSHRFRRLRDEIRHYFRQRSEDSIDLE